MPRLARLLCCASLLSAVCASAVPEKLPSKADARAAKVLDRMTFGPRPGEAAAVERMGLKRWLDVQLHPGKIPDSDSEARLSELPAMALPQGELMERFPSRQTLRISENRQLALPGGAQEHAVYADALFAYDNAKARKEADAGAGATASTPQPAFSPADAQAILQLPHQARFARVLALPPEQFAAFRADLKGPDLARLAEGLSPEERETLAALNGPQRMVENEVLGSRLLRDVYSGREIEAVMTDFWLNHFNVFLHKDGEMPYLLPSYERDVIRPRALGRFSDLLAAVAQSPAMLKYLDNAESIGPDSPAAQRKGKGKDAGLNENYARELLELHTVGARCEASAAHPPASLPRECGGGYTQRDVTEVAEVFTGWTTSKPDEGAAFRFEPRRHEPGPKQVLGQAIPEGGESEGLALLRKLADSPATARFVSEKLAVRFVGDNPPPALTARMAKAWEKSGGDIAVVLRTMIGSKEFQAAPPKLKTPEEFWISALRASGAEITNAPAAAGAMARLGMGFYGAQQPNGYAWTAGPWANGGGLLSRLNLALEFSAGCLPGVAPRWPALPASEPTGQAQARERSLEALLLPHAASERTRSAVLTEAAPSANAPAPADPAGTGGVRKAALLLGARPRPAPVDAETARIAGLLLGSPEFQER